MARAWRGHVLFALRPGENGSGRGPDAGRTIEFEETDADRTRAGRGRGRFSLGHRRFLHHFPKKCGFILKGNMAQSCSKCDRN
eukprot:gene1743-biopygen16859